MKLRTLRHAWRIAHPPAMSGLTSSEVWAIEHVAHVGLRLLDARGKNTFYAEFSEAPDVVVVIARGPAVTRVKTAALEKHARRGEE